MARKSIPDADLAARVQSAALHLLRRLDREDERGGASPARLAALSVLVLDGPCTIGRLAAFEGVAAPTMTRLVDGMVAAGLVERLPAATDRRVVGVQASERGRAVLLAGLDRRTAILGSMIAPLSPKERRRLRTAAAIVERMVRRAG
jgi:DNA-binding MarR family transcriptional regulator